MSEDVQNEHAFGPVVDSGDQSVVVTVDVEYGPAPYYLCMSEIMLRASQRIPVCPLGDSVPVHKQDQCIWMPLGESKNGRFADYPQISLQNVNANIHSCCSFEVRYSNCWAPLNRCPLAASELPGSGGASIHAGRSLFLRKKV
jgi:hypothetical protein